MNKGLEALLLFWLVSLIFHYLKKYLNRVYAKREEIYKNDLSKNNYKKYFLESFKTYLNVLSIMKWFSFVLGIFAFLREYFM
jgi:hypothetical protein